MAQYHHSCYIIEWRLRDDLARRYPMSDYWVQFWNPRTGFKETLGKVPLRWMAYNIVEEHGCPDPFMVPVADLREGV